MEEKGSGMTREEYKKQTLEDIAKWGDDLQLFRNFLMDAANDGCIALPYGWYNSSIEEMRELCAEAWVTAAERMMSGEALPSEMKEKTPGSVQ